MNIDKFIIEKERLWNLIDKNTKRYTDLLRPCEHPKEMVTVKEKYYNGGYDYVASTVYITKCKLCGKILNEDTITHTGRHG